MQLVEVEYAYVARYARMAARDHVSVAPTKDTQWYRTPGHEGFCGLLRLRDGSQRVKGVYVHPEWRGLGIGKAMTDALLAIAAGAGRIEVLAYRPDFYEKRGFARVNQLPNGAWRLEKR